MSVRPLEAGCGSSMTPVDSLNGFTPVTDANGVQASVTVGFCEGSDYVVDIFCLATDSSGATYLFVHELVQENANSGAFSPPTLFVDVPGWQKTNEDLKGWNGIHIGTYTHCGQQGDFTRSVQTGSGAEGRTGNLVATTEIDVCFHRRDQNDKTVIKYDSK